MNRMLKKFSFVMAIGLIAVLITGCTKKPDKNQIVAEINNYQLTVDDFKYEAELSLSGASNEQILQDIITKELLLQEAQKNSLDKNRRFMKEIENYWKQTLIKRLIYIKGEEFLASIKGNESKEMKLRKAQVLLDQWINQLKNNANIKKYDPILNSIVIKKASNQDGGANE